MKVKTMIENLEKCNPEAEIKLHCMNGNNALFVVGHEGNEDVVVIEDKDDNDLRSELCARFENAVKEQADELDFFMDLLDQGFTMDDIRENVPEHYEYARAFCKDHGLI